MNTVHFSTTVLSILLTVAAGVFYGGFLLYGTWIDGRRQSVRDQGLHPVTEETGAVHAREERNQDGSKRR